MRLPPPQPIPPTRLPVRRAVAIVYLGLALAALLEAQTLLGSVSRLPHGPARDGLVAAVQPLLSLSQALGMDRPGAAIRSLLGRQDAFAAAHATIQVSTPTPPPATCPTAPLPDDAPPPAPATPRRVTEDDPAVLWVVGDSMINMGAPRIQKLLEATGRARVITDSRPNTGMVRVDYFDWTAALRSRLQELGAPDIVILMMGANDSQNMRVDGRRVERWTPGWRAEYGRRAGDLMQVLIDAGVHVYWVGMPVMRSGAHQRTADLVNAALAEQAGARPRAHYIPMHDKFMDHSGRYARWLLDDSGRRYAARASDGVHFTWTGSNHLAASIIAVLDKDWHLTDGDPASSTPPE